VNIGGGGGYANCSGVQMKMHLQDIPVPYTSNKLYMIPLNPGLFFCLFYDNINVFPEFFEYYSLQRLQTVLIFSYCEMMFKLPPYPHLAQLPQPGLGNNTHWDFSCFPRSAPHYFLSRPNSTPSLLKRGGGGGLERLML
jgi:hypothetical protein